MFVEFIFWLSIAMILYTYIGYPIFAFILSSVTSKKVAKSEFSPTVTVIIAAYNEEMNIEETVRNKLMQNYPKNLIEVIVVSDGSSDNTDNIVQNIADNRVRLIRQDLRSGKTSAINLGVTEAKGEILVFSDANSIYDKNAIYFLVKNFFDANVGYVTGKMTYVNSEATIVGDGCNAYMRYENALRTIETRLGSIVGVDGGIDAIRKNLYHPMSPDQLPDFVLPLKVVEQGYRVVYEPNSLLYENSLKAPSDEYRMRIRVSLRAFWALFDMRKLLFFKNSLIFSWQLWSHKVLRYCCFVFLATALVTNVVLCIDSIFYLFLFLTQFLLYLISFLSLYFSLPVFQHPFAKFVAFFTLLNIASAHAFLKFIIGKKAIVWTPRKG